MIDRGSEQKAKKVGSQRVGGWAGRLLARFAGASHRHPRLRMVERITLAPRQSLALVEAEGRLLLVATSADGAPAFYPLDESGRVSAAARQPLTTRMPQAARVSW